jgi:hypothetical protein
MRITFLAFVVLILFGSPYGAPPTTPFSLAIVPTTSLREGGGITMAHNAPEEFYVVLKNISGVPQAVWETSNSWGFQTISFEFVTADGTKTVVSQREQIFTANVPSTFIIQPGEQQVYPIRLDKSWLTHPTLRNADEMPISVKAVYEVPPTPEAAQQKVWTGRLESRSYSFVLRQW